MNTLNDIKYLRIIFLRTIPLQLFNIIILFFFAYQIAIGNRFLEEIDPSVVLGIFLLFSLTITYFLTTFRVKYENGKFHIRMGFTETTFSETEIKEINKIKNGEYTYGVSNKQNKIVFKVDRCEGIEIKLPDRIIVIFEKNFTKYLSSENILEQKIKKTSFAQETPIHTTQTTY
ncbi:MAG: hypothetical protein N2712_04440 [Brevinematales bacterium]|nr:hypothetical protein [Brevinematales bacterium]